MTRNFTKDQYLLTKNKFIIDNRKIDEDELTGYLQQVPNQKLFGLFRTGIAFYNAGSKGKDTRFKKWMRTKLGSPPVLLDTSLNVLARKQMSIYLDNIGYFGNTVRDSVLYEKKKAKVFYIINTKAPYTIRDITLSVHDTALYPFIMKDTARSLLKRGKNFNAYNMGDERTRMTTNLINYGYYRFSSNYVVFHVDSNLRTRQVDINIEVKNPAVGEHRRYFINNIYIFPEYELLQTDTTAMDTIVRSFEGAGKDTTESTYYFIAQGKISVSPSILAQSIIIKKGNHFNQPDVNVTYTNLTSLQVYKFVNITFTEVPATDSVSPRLLNCRIQLSRSLTQTFSVSTDGTNSSGAFGVQGNFSSQHRNIFGGAQMLRLNLTASAQMQGNLGNTVETGLLNTIELGANANLIFPQFLLPIKPERFAKKYRPRTTITLGYNYQRQPDYDRHITNGSFGYSFNQNPYLKHTFNPVELSFVKIFPDSTFTANLEETTDKRLKNQYTDHMVAGLRYTITYSSQDVTRLKDFVYIRSNIENGGLLLYGINSIFDSKKNSNGQYTLFRIPYSQYFRPDLDTRYYHLINSLHSWVGRFYGGIGIPYGNSNTLPFEKAFFAGGANDLRGWKMGSLGPGSYSNDTSTIYFDQTGDIQLQVNFEYRFPVYDFIRSAVFVDAGNVWLLNDNPEYPGGKFRFDTFISQVAIDVGIGLRADFEFFIFRLDPAVPIRLPSSDTPGHWYLGKIQWKDVTWNFGIGYPF